MKDSTDTIKNDSGILIVEDDPAVRDTLCQVISHIDDVNLLAAVDTIRDALQHLRNARPQLVLCDLGLPDGDGVQVIQYCAASDIPAMVISIFDDEPTVLRAIEAGATGYLLKDQPEEVLRTAVADLLAGGSPITPSIARFLLKQLSGNTDAAGSGSRHRRAGTSNGRAGKGSADKGSADKSRADDGSANNGAATTAAAGNAAYGSSLLSDREKEVLSLLAQGYKSKEVAGKLTLSHHTIASHQRNVYAKLCVKNKSEAVAVAMKKGLIDP